jgi:hypothetical protein
MTCNRRPAPSDEEIVAALEGTVRPELEEHIAGCGDCAERLAQMRREHAALLTTLRRVDCPDTHELGEYYVGLLTPSRERTIISHLDHCLRCRDELAILRVFSPPEPRSIFPQPPVPSGPPLSWPARVFSPVIALLLASTSNTSLAGVRGAGDGPFVARCPEATIIIEVHGAAGGRFEIDGQIADDQGDQERWTGALVEVRQGRSLLAFATVDDLGGFHCSDLPGRDFDVQITAENGLSIVVEQIGSDRAATG